MENPSNFSDARILSVIKTDQGSEGIMNMIGEVTQALGTLSAIITEREIMKSVTGRVPIPLNPSSMSTQNNFLAGYQHCR